MFKNAKYEATGETRVWNGITLHRIRAVADMPAIGVVAGDFGGWIEKEDNLSTTGAAWVYPDAFVCHNARILGGTFMDGVFRGGEFWGGTFWGGTFLGGEFLDGVFRGGVFRGGVFRGGVFLGGVFRGGVFLGGEFLGGEFLGGVFSGGVFRGGTFLGGTFHDGEFTKAITCQRSDGYVFTLNPAEPGKPMIAAGCRYFTFDEAEEHWRRTRGGTPLGDETFDILDLMKKQAIRHGFMEPASATMEGV